MRIVPLLVPGERDRIDPDKWRPLIMSFQQFYGLTPRLQQSTLATIPESAYRPQRTAIVREDAIEARVESGGDGNAVKCQA